METKRTLVKSPPEVWAQVSDVACLADQLGEFGEIRITRVEPESVVEWEGERASGTVRLEPSGWGTRVTLTAEVPEPTPATVPEPTPGGPVEDPGPATVPEPTPDPVPEPTPDEPSAPDIEPPPAPETAQLKKGGFFKRLFAREPEPAPERYVPKLQPEPVAEPLVEQQAFREEPETAPHQAPAPAPTASPTSQEPSNTPEPEPEPQLAPDRALEILTGTLDHLGAAHHRPFSRG